MAELLVAHQKLESCLFSLGIRNVWDVRWFWRDGNDCLCELESCEGVSRSDIQVLYLTRVARANLAECFGAIHGGITLQFCEGCLLMEITCCREPSETSEDIDSLAAVITACAGCYAKCPPFQRKVCELFRLAVTHFLDLPALGLTPVHWDDEASIVAAESLAMSSASRCSTGHLSQVTFCLRRWNRGAIELQVSLANPSLVQLAAFLHKVSFGGPIAAWRFYNALA